MATMAEILARKKTEMASKKASGQRTIKPENGKHTYRVLPTWRKAKEGAEADPTFWHDFGQHWVRAEAKGKPVALVCMEKTFSQACDVCLAIGSAISHSHDDETVKLLEEAKAQQKYLMNVLHLTSTDEAKKKTPQILEVGSTCFNAILDIMETYGDITSLTEGIDLIITKSGTGFETSYSVIPAPKSAKLSPSIMESVSDLDAYAAQMNETKKSLALANLSTAAGLLPAPDGERTAPRAALGLRESAEDTAFEEMPSFDEDEVPFEVDEPTTKATPAARAPMTDDLDDLDDILAELG